MLFDDFEDDKDGEGPLPAGTSYGAELLPAREMAECFGHEGIEKQILTLIDENKLPHALIFSGPEGIGKATMAFRLARFLLNQKSSDDGPGLFGEPLPATKVESLHVAPDDPVFRQVASGGHPDFLLIERLMDEKKGKRQGRIAVEEVRRITPFLRMKAAHDGGWRVVIVDDADMMTPGSQNAILKILEEPPPRTVLILVAHRPGAMVATIRSRCRVIPFQQPSLDVFKDLIRRVESVQKIMMLLSGWPRWDWPQIHAQAEVIGRGGSVEALHSFSTILEWIVESILRARATDQTPAGVLNNDTILRLMNHYPLADWIQICENLKVHFETASFANLDKRQAVIGAFSLLDHKEAA